MTRFTKHMLALLAIGLLFQVGCTDIDDPQQTTQQQTTTAPEKIERSSLKSQTLGLSSDNTTLEVQTNEQDAAGLCRYMYFSYEDCTIAGGEWRPVYRCGMFWCWIDHFACFGRCNY